MGKDNKARRSAKAKAKNKARRMGPAEGRGFKRPGGGAGAWAPPRAGEPLFTQEELVENMLVRAAGARRRGDDFVGEALAKLASMPPPVVDRQAEELLVRQVDLIWQGGWQPAELKRQGRLGCASAAARRLVDLAIATDHARRRAATLDPRWMAQVDSLGLPPVDGRHGWLARWTAAEGLDRPPALAAVVDALANLLHLPRLDPVLPPPGSTGEQRSGSPVGEPVGAEADPVLDRIRNLLAKAESTGFEAEATALTAKAQELMTRHAIDAAVVHSRSGAADDATPVAVRVPVDAPYADAKSLLLQTVAGAGRCRSVFHHSLSMSTVVGFAEDVSAVEVLFTSLLVQAQTALTAAARRAPVGTRTRSQSYRSAFLLAYTGRIGDRLEEINDAVYAEAEAESGESFLPVLRSRSNAIDDHMASRFGEMVSSPVRGGYDQAGWAGGRLAADNAQLTFGDLADPGGGDEAPMPPDPSPALGT